MTQLQVQEVAKQQWGVSVKKGITREKEQLNLEKMNVGFS